MKGWASDREDFSIGFCRLRKNIANPIAMPRITAPAIAMPAIAPPERLDFDDGDAVVDDVGVAVTWEEVLDVGMLVVVVVVLVGRSVRS